MSNLLAALGALLIVICVFGLFGLLVAGLVLGGFLMLSAWSLHVQAKPPVGPSRAVE